MRPAERDRDIRLRELKGEREPFGKGGLIAAPARLGDGAGEGEAKMGLIGGQAFIYIGEFVGNLCQGGPLFGAVGGEKRAVFVMEAGEFSRGGRFFERPEGGEGKEFGEEVFSIGGACEAGFVFDGEVAEFCEDSLGEKPCALVYGVGGMEVREDFRVPNSARGRAAF